MNSRENIVLRDSKVSLKDRAFSYDWPKQDIQEDKQRRLLEQGIKSLEKDQEVYAEWIGTLVGD